MSVRRKECRKAQLMNNQEVPFYIQYIGSIAVNRSMRTIQYDLRTAVTKEAIVKVCAAAKCKKDFKRPKQIKQIEEILQDKPKLSKVHVEFSVSLDGLKTTVKDINKQLFYHFMSAISFASSGETPFKQFVGYIAKDQAVGRACHVFNCYGDSYDVISTIGQAFEIKYKDVLTKHSQDLPELEPIFINDRFFNHIFDEEVYEETQLVSHKTRHARSRSEHSFPKLYENIPRRAVSTGNSALTKNIEHVLTNNIQHVLTNNIDNKIFYLPDEAKHDRPEAKWPRTDYCNSPQVTRANDPLKTKAQDDINIAISPMARQCSRQDAMARQCSRQDAPPTKPPRPKYSSVAIYQNTDKPTRPVPQSPVPSRTHQSPVPRPQSPTRGTRGSSLVSDMTRGSSSDELELRATPEELRRNLDELEQSLNQISTNSADVETADTSAFCIAHEKMSWFHGKIGREEAEKVLQYQGDYLVRSHGNGQFVLSCMDKGFVRHLLLVDPEGQIRTKDRQFSSITELITHYATSGECIVSEGCALKISRPVSQSHPT